MGNKLCQTVSLCSCLNPKDFDSDESMELEDCKQTQREKLKNDTSFYNNIFTVCNESFNFELLNQSKQTESAEIERPLYVDTELASSSSIGDSDSLDSGFDSRNMTPSRSLSQINFPAPSLVLSVANTDDTMNNFYEFLLSETIFMQSNLVMDSVPFMVKDKMWQWSKRSIGRIKRTAMKYFFFKNLTKNTVELADESKCETKSRISDLIKKPFSILSVLANGLKFLNRFSLKHSSFSDDCSDTVGLIEPSYSFSPLRQFLMRIYDINFF
ncbi:hypothetical protein BpHYR1_046041 [Brachionus plicatilis]|uniref:Uncharacterized protein n=1 Tax=Brachionus plicatilis TaxID=10195 RepID=A0A3M7P6H9_BRAPC|nr:hypothetical protein BpHYR1_046041 [Brachionus plicatilis]